MCISNKTGALLTIKYIVFDDTQVTVRLQKTLVQLKNCVCNFQLRYIIVLYKTIITDF